MSKMRPRSPEERKDALKLGRYSDEREAWATLSFIEVIMYHEYTEEGDEVALGIKRGQRYQRVNLSDFMETELEAFKTIVDRAIEAARPICIRHDKEADEAWKAGDDSHSRSYRRLPQLVIREGRKPEHDSGVPSGPDGAVDGSGGSDSDGGA